MILSVVGIIAFLLIIMFLFSSGSFFNSPSYVVVNRWYDDNEKRINLNEYVFKEDICFHTTIDSSKFKNPKLVVKIKNANLIARTNGKVLVDTRRNAISGYGAFYHIIDVSDVDEGVVYMYLSPCKHKKGEIKNTVYLTTQNDFLYSFLTKSRLMILLLGGLEIAIVYFLYMNIKTRKREWIVLSLDGLGLLLLLVCKSGFVQFFTNNQEFAYIMTVLLETMLFLLNTYLLFYTLYKKQVY